MTYLNGEQLKIASKNNYKPENMFNDDNKIGLSQNKYISVLSLKATVNELVYNFKDRINHFHIKKWKIW